MQGKFSRINFREDLYLGGYTNVSKLYDRTGLRHGFSGCIRRLKVNDKLYDMRRGAFIGDALRGLDVGQFEYYISIIKIKKRSIRCPEESKPYSFNYLPPLIFFR